MEIVSRDKYMRVKNSIHNVDMCMFMHFYYCFNFN